MPAIFLLSSIAVLILFLFCLNKKETKNYSQNLFLFLMVFMRTLRLVQGQPAFRQAGPIAPRVCPAIPPLQRNVYTWYPASLII
jgi:hypothetical protein